MATRLVDKLETMVKQLEKAQEKTAIKIHKDTQNNAPNEVVGYVNSIQLSDTVLKDGVIYTAIYSDMLVGGSIEKWQNVPMAAFMEWGTGPMGESSNTYNHQYYYTTDKPWNFEAQRQFEEMGTWGMLARPHFYPALTSNISTNRENIKEALK